MRLTFCVFLVLVAFSAKAQSAEDWDRLRNYAHTIGVDSLCALPERDCLTRYFTQIIYGASPRRLLRRIQLVETDVVKAP